MQSKDKILEQALLAETTDQAINILLDATKENPSEEMFWFYLGTAYRKKEDWQNAMNAFLKAIEINPNSQAKLAYDAIAQILAFYDTNRYNQ